MNYLNPYLLLDIKPGSSDDTPAGLKRRRKELLNRIALDGDIRIDGRQIDRSTAIGALEDLDFEQLRNFHCRVLRSDELHDFLRFGKFTGALAMPKRPPEFVDFVRPFLLNGFVSAIDQSLSDGNREKILDLFASNFPFTVEDKIKAHRPVRRHFKQIQNTLNETTEQVLEGNAITSFAVLASIIPISQIDCLNALPLELQDINDDVANAVNSLGVALYNEADDYTGAQAAFSRASRIRCGAQTRERIIDNRKIADNIIHKTELAAISQKLERIIGGVKARTVDSAEEVVTIVCATIKPSRLSSISNASIDSDLIAVTKQLQEIAWLCVTSYRSSPAGALILNLCLELELSDAAVTKALHSKIREVQLRITHSAIPTAKQGASGVNQKSGARSTSIHNNVKSRRAAPASGPSNFNPTILASDGILTRMQKEIYAVSGRQAILMVGAAVAITFLLFITSKNQAPPSAKADLNKNSNVATVGNSNFNTLSKIPIPSPSGTRTPNPVPSVRPSSGTILERSGSGGLGQLRVSNGLSVDAIVKLRSSAAGKTVRSIYIRGGSKITISGISPGDYEVVVATGYDYSASDKSFKSSPKFEKMNHTFTYVQSRESGGTRFKIFEITLDKSAYGTLSSSTIDPAEFDK